VSALVLVLSCISLSLVVSLLVTTWQLKRVLSKQLSVINSSSAYIYDIIYPITYRTYNIPDHTRSFLYAVAVHMYISMHLGLFFAA
jgi:hypothetical protein